jgi:hypothetical protein
MERKNNKKRINFEKKKKKQLNTKFCFKIRATVIKNNRELNKKKKRDAPSGCAKRRKNSLHPDFHLFGTDKQFLYVAHLVS